MVVLTDYLTFLEDPLDLEDSEEHIQLKEYLQ